MHLLEVTSRILMAVLLLLGLTDFALADTNCGAESLANPDIVNCSQAVQDNRY